MIKFLKKITLSFILVTSFTPSYADEGMWFLHNLSSHTDSILNTLGLELTHEQLYSLDKPSLNDAIVSFGGFCSGVVVSDDGLVFTNHHCGFSSIQEHSTVKNDYLKYGFNSKSFKEELPNPGLFVAFHLKTIDVTDKVLSAVNDSMSKNERNNIIDSVCIVLEEQIEDKKKSIYGEVNRYYGDTKFYMSVYQHYTDVRLVFAPPQSMGKFGGDSDNWVWPRQTCDFSVFRIYADKNNNPANYSKSNVPYKPKKFAHISIKGYEPGDYCMTIGYPGSTNRYLSSYGIKNTIKNNDVRIKVRGIKQEILKKAMNADDQIRIMYSSKYAQSSNYWKYSIGQNQALEKLDVIKDKEELESKIRNWYSDKGYYDVLDSLNKLYNKFDKNIYVQTMIQESFMSGSDVLQMALNTMVHQVSDSKKNNTKKNFIKKYKDIDIELDKKIFTALLKNFKENVDREDWPDFIEEIETIDKGDVDAYVNNLWKKSVFADKNKICKVKNTNKIANDIMYDVAISVLAGFYSNVIGSSIKENEVLLEKALRGMQNEKELYPDANSSLRLSFGSIKALSDKNDYYTVPTNIIAKNESKPSNFDYELLPSVKQWLEEGDYGKRYEDKKTGKLQLCFISNNDITGGNSGSGMFDSKGRLIGLAFDGNWEAMSGDIKYDDNLQRCIGVDIRYVLSVIEKYGKADRLIKEVVIEE